jgi:RNA polymerase sigma factor (sigma-70 family)
MLSRLQNKEREEEDKLFWGKFLAGDDKAYIFFYRKYVKVLFSYGLRFTFDAELVKDCIQDIFVTLYSNRSNLTHIKQIQVYLFVSLKNKLYTVFQKDKSVYHIDTIEPVFCVDYTAEERMIADEQEQEKQEQMNRILESLTPRQKEIIYYRYVQGMEIEEISKLMKMNCQSVRNLIHRSIQKVKNSFVETKSVLYKMRKVQDV